MHTLDLSPQMTRSTGDTGGGENTIGAQIRRLAQVQPDHAAVVASGFAPLSYRELQYLIDEIRTALRLRGLGRNARIAVAIPNGPQAALAIVAVTCSAVSIPLDPRETVAELESPFSVLRPDALLLLRGTDSGLRQLAIRRGMAIIEAIASKDETLCFSIDSPETRIASAPDDFCEPNSDDVALISQTSGTTSARKLIPRKHRNLLAAAAMFQTWFKLTPQDRSLCLSPVAQGQGLVATVLMTFLSGGTVVFPANASRFDYSEWFGTLKPTWFTCAPTHHRLILDQTRFRANASTEHSLRFILSGGAPLPPDIHEGLEHALGVPVLDRYGFSEGTHLSANLPPPGPFKPGTCGIPWPGTVIVVGEDGCRLPPGVQGEILVSGPTIMSGYIGAPELNRQLFVDGWFKTGDIGSLDDEGFLTLHGRLNELINRGGDKVSPTEINNVLTRHRAVAEAATFPVPHSRLGEDVMAAVVLRSGMTATPTELRRYLQDRLAPFKVPRRIFVRDQLPKGNTGKIVSRLLTESWEEAGGANAQIGEPSLDDDPLVANNLIAGITELWERLLKHAPISIDDDFFEKGGDSLLAMEMLAELDRLTGQTLPNAILFEASTIRQLTQKLSESGHLNEKQETFIRLNSEGNRAPLFFFHDDYNGRGYWILRLARLLGSDQPLLIIPPHGNGNEPIPPTIEAMAADRLPLIIDAQAEGPYRLSGFCGGGIVAFEVARLLIAAGKSVEMVVMLDTPTVTASRPVQLLFSLIRSARPIVGPVADRAKVSTLLACASLQRSFNVSWTRRWTAIKHRFWKLGAGAAERSPSEQADATRAAQTFAALSTYRPKPLGVRVLYISIDYDVGPWRRISSDLERIKSPGNHYQVDVGDIAEHLRARLQAKSVNAL
jgi:acyl-CoA synthetase (AMP-forming)/AMP-acid ligase II/thioesterase domain-containing protein